MSKCDSFGLPLSVLTQLLQGVTGEALFKLAFTTPLGGSYVC